MAKETKIRLQNSAEDDGFCAKASSVYHSCHLHFFFFFSFRKGLDADGLGESDLGDR